MQFQRDEPSLTSQEMEVSYLPIAQAKVGTIGILRVILCSDPDHTRRTFPRHCS